MTLSTSDIDTGRQQILHHAAAEFIAALCLAGFGAVYEHFSFGVYSNDMIYAFIYPLISGLLLLFTVLRMHLPQARTLFLLHASTAACAVGSIAAGILHISGRDHKLLLVYPLLGAALFLLALFSYRKDGQKSE